MIFITGGAGFIGSNFILHWLSNNDEPIVNIDKLTYAGNLQNLKSLADNKNYIFVKADICDGQSYSQLLTKYRPRAVIHFAAESHVDRSISGPKTFIDTNIVGTFTVLDRTQNYWSNLPANERNSFRFLHVSTDEVYGSLQAQDPAFTELTRFAPNSPYAASKAASDHLVRAYHHTYGFPTITSNCSNNYGPYQFPEKLIPLLIQRALNLQPIPIYGDGSNIRDWLFVTDHCRALELILKNGKVGETYNVGGRNEMKNVDVVDTACQILDEVKPRPDSLSYKTQKTFVADRPGHDKRYAVDTTKISRELGWAPTENFNSGLRKTIGWYLENQSWISDLSRREQK